MKISHSIQGNLNLRDALRVAAELGCHIWEKSANGETVFEHRLWSKPIVVNHRRKDTNMVLMCKLRKLYREMSKEVS